MPAYQPPQQMLDLKCSFKKDSMKLTFLLAVPAQPAPLNSVKKYEENEPFQVSDPKYMLLYGQKKHWQNNMGHHQFGCAMFELIWDLV